MNALVAGSTGNGLVGRWFYRDPSTALDSLSSRAIHSIGICALVVALSGCVPLAPYARGPGSIESQGPLGEETPEFIVAGKTTRQQVLAHLGAPRIEALDGSWSYYESDYLKSESGAWYLIAIPFLAGTIARIPGTNEFSFRRLHITYTADSRVSSASFAEQKCHDVYKYSHIEFPSISDAAKCPILQRHLDLKQARLSERMQSAIPSGQGAAQWFEHALWHKGQGRYMLGIVDELQCFREANRRLEGVLGISRDELVFLPGEKSPVGGAANIEKIPIAQIQDLNVIDGLLDKGMGIDIELFMGQKVSFAFCKDGSNASDVKKTSEAASLLKRNIAAAKK